MGGVLGRSVFIIYRCEKGKVEKPEVPIPLDNQGQMVKGCHYHSSFSDSVGGGGGKD